MDFMVSLSQNLLNHHCIYIVYLFPRQFGGCSWSYMIFLHMFSYEAYHQNAPFFQKTLAGTSTVAHLNLPSPPKLQQKTTQMQLTKPPWNEEKSSPLKHFIVGKWPISFLGAEKKGAGKKSGGFEVVSFVCQGSTWDKALEVAVVQPLWDWVIHWPSEARSQQRATTWKYRKWLGIC